MTVLGFLSASSALMAANSSMRLLVVMRSPPKISFSCSPERRIAAQPPGPGLPLHAPSVKISTGDPALFLFTTRRPPQLSHCGGSADGGRTRADLWGEPARSDCG